jgi:hypothetical protein
VQENEDIVREYGKRELLVEVDTGNGTEESWEKLYHRLEKHIKWIDVSIAKQRTHPRYEARYAKMLHALLSTLNIRVQSPNYIWQSKHIRLYEIIDCSRNALW